MNPHTLEFLSSLYGEFDDNQFLYLWTLPGRETHPFSVRDIPGMAQAVANLAQNHDVYFGVGTTARAMGKHERSKNDDVVAIPGLWVDIDILNPEAHKVQALPPDIGSAMDLLPGELPPSLVVWSGYGIHVYWLFREPWELDTPEERTRAADLLRALQAQVKQNAALRGWKIDTTADLARILRMPGTLNRKNPANPVQCLIIERSETRYNQSDIEDRLPEVPPNPRQSRTEQFERRPTDGPAERMLKNCRFLQHCQLNAASITYDEWLAAITNIVRASDGIQAAHQVSALDPARYKPEDTDKKINEALSAMNPQTCDYIRNTIGFQGCPAAGCGVQAPCGWSLSKVAQARAVVRNVHAPAPESVFIPEVLGALAVLKKDDPTEYAKFKATCKGRVNLNELEKLVKQQRKASRQDNHLQVVQPGDKPAQRMLRDTVPELPVDLVLPPNFRFEKSGVLYVKENSNGELMTYKAAGAPVVISERVFNVDTEMEKLEICFKYLNGWRKVLFPRSTVFDSRKVMRLADYGVPISSESAKYTVKWLDALADTNKNIPVTYAVSKLGWRGDRDFVLPTFNQQYRVDIDDDGSQSTVSGFSVTGTPVEWLARMQYLRQSPKARFILAASFAAPLLKLLGQRNFILHNWGNSQDGKTATLWAAMSVWGNPDRLIGTFDTTPTALERKAAIHSDLPLAINEREVLNRFRKNDINPLLYVLGEGRGRARGTKTGLQHLATWRTVALSTGEGTLSNSGSLDGVMTRVLEVCDGPLAHDRDFARGLYYFLPRCHGHAGVEFLRQLLTSDYAAILNTYRDFQSLFRRYYPDRIDSHIDAVSCVATADYLASGWVFSETWEQAHAGALAAAHDVVAGLVTRSEASESERAWEAFVDWIAENQDRFTDRSPGPRFGYREGADIYVIRAVVDRFLNENFSNSRKIVREWANSGFIASNYESGKIRYDFRGKSIESGVRPRVLKLNGTVLRSVGQWDGVGQPVGQV